MGFALKHEGYSIDDWDNWSRRDMARYHDGETEKKWEKFNGSAKPVTGVCLSFSMIVPAVQVYTP